MDMDDHRICFVGDSFVHGTCDSQCRGWPGRVTADAQRHGFNVTHYNLGVRRDTSREIAARWHLECAIRLPENVKRYVVFSLGVNDVAYEGDIRRVSEEDSIRNFRAIISQASSLYQIAVIGPPPVADEVSNRHINHISTLFESIAQQSYIPYLPVFDALLADPVWMSQVQDNDGSHPGAEGYDALARLIVAWPSWWFRHA